MTIDPTDYAPRLADDAWADLPRPGDLSREDWRRYDSLARGASIRRERLSIRQKLLALEASKHARP